MISGASVGGADTVGAVVGTGEVVAGGKSSAGTGDAVASTGSVGARLVSGGIEVSAPVGSPMVPVADDAPGTAIEGGGVAGVEDVQPIRPTTSAIPRTRRPLCITAM